MPTLYVENVPEDLYEAIRERAKSERRSIAAEVIALLKLYCPTKKELKAREEFFKNVRRLRLKKLPGRAFAPAEEMIREDRER